MQDIEPFERWKYLYDSSEDDRSPFYGVEHSEFEYTRAIYNFYIHPQWDYFGSETLYLKVIFTDYDSGYAILELLGEWNDAINNDIMFLKRDIIEEMENKGIRKFVLIGENVLNFHASDDCYYQEWFEEVEDGWIVALNFREHVLKEFTKNNIDYYLAFGGELDRMNWRTFLPNQLIDAVEKIMSRRIGS